MIGGIDFEERGPPGAPAVILSPGLGGQRGYWEPTLAALTAQHRVILYDHRGTGRSERTLPAGLTVEDMADDLLRVIEGLGLERATIVGHAAGGAIGMALALRAPERVERLVAVNGWAAPDPHFARCMEARLILLEHSVRAFARAQPIFLYPARWISEHSDALDEQAEAQIAHFQGEENVRLAEIAVPVLLVAAEDDMLVPASCSERLAQGLPNATLARMTGGHACNVTHPDIFNAILLAWLAGAPIKGAS